MDRNVKQNWNPSKKCKIPYYHPLWKYLPKNANSSTTADQRGKRLIYSESVDNNGNKKDQIDKVLPLWPLFGPPPKKTQKMQILPQPLVVETKKWYILDL